MKKGIELGIKAPLSSIKKAAELADTKSLDYFLVAETHPKVMGVNALDAINKCSDITSKVTLGTGIINVFSREKEDLLEEANILYKKTGKRLILGLGTSAPVIVEQMYNLKFEKPVSRIKEYTKYLEQKFDGPIYWAAVGEKMIKLAMKMSDGILFFLKPKKQLAEITNEINKTPPHSSFQTISIIPTFIDTYDGNKLAKKTLAGYIGANQFYSKPLLRNGFKEDVLKIIDIYTKFGFAEACKVVSNQLVEELTIIGSADECIEKIRKYQKTTGVDTIITGYDLAKDEFNVDFFKKLDRLLSVWK